MPAHESRAPGDVRAPCVCFHESLRPAIALPRTSVMNRHLLVLTVLFLFPWTTQGADTGAEETQLREAGIGIDGPALLQYFRSRTINDTDRARVEAQIRQLSAEDFADREKASQELIRLGPVAEPLLRRAAENPDPEVKRRAEECLRKLAAGSTPTLIGAAARVLAVRKPPEAAAVLLAYAPFAPEPDAATEVRNALATVALREGKPDPVLVAGLTDKQPAKRTAAGAALARVLSKEVRKLLQDAEPSVRIGVALALAVAGEKDAIPALIAAQTEIQGNDRALAEDLLLALAGDSLPPGVTNREAQTRRDAWMKWWQANSDKADLTRLQDEHRTLGYTLVVARDGTGTLGRVMELDRTGRVRWELEGLRAPLDLQILPGGNLLVSEYTGNRITERTRQGDIVWNKPVTGILVNAQRLADGKTFVATRNRVVMLDREGNETVLYTRPTTDVYSAQRGPNGEIALVTRTGICIRLDATGKEETTFQTGPTALYHGIDLLPNGNVLIPLTTTGRVAEFDPKGKLVWEVRVTSPMSATRLRNGNTLVASAAGRTLYEFDQQGKEVRQTPMEVRPYRVYRR